MVRGIEKRRIFLDDKDRQSFVDRFSELLLKTQTSCIAWSLMTNHFHLLLQPEDCTLALFMRRLLTGYAVTFNLRHHRVGHLFQNRYKSIVCEEESYLLELTRYIHLNPLRSGLVKNVNALDSYPWCGHAVLMGGRAFAGQDTAAVLSRFGNDLKTARLSYRSFVRDGVRQGHRDEFSGGGMRRSAKAQGMEPGAEAFDERVLGSGAFVEHLLEFHDMPERQKQPVLSLEKLIDAVCATYGIAVGSLGSVDKNRTSASARAVTCYLAVRQLGYKGTEVARTLHITPSCVAVSLKRGDALLKQDAKAQEVLANIKISTTSP